MFGLLPSIGPWELLVVLAIVLIIFGPGKLPDIGKSLGKSIKEFRSASKGSIGEEEKTVNETANETKE